MIDSEAIDKAVNIIILAPYLVAGASAIVAMFPAPKANAALKKLHKALTVLALNVRHAKGGPQIRDK